MTEYEVPINTKIPGVTAKGAECHFDPELVLEREFEKDEEKQREMEKQLFGADYQNEVMIVED